MKAAPGSPLRLLRVADWSLVTRVVVLCVAISLLFAAGVTAIGYVSASRGLAEQADARLTSDATGVSRGVDDWNSKHLQLARSVATLPILIQALQAGPNVTAQDTATISDLLQSMGALSDGSGVTITDADGIARFGGSSSASTTLGRSFAARDYFKAAVQGRDYISSVAMSIAGTGGQTLFVSTPV